jgi:hypothetical protein
MARARRWWAARGLPMVQVTLAWMLGRDGVTAIRQKAVMSGRFSTAAFLIGDDLGLLRNKEQGHHFLG